MTPLFLNQCPRKNPMQENRCNYLRVFLLSNIRVQSGCCNWPTQQRISLAAIPHSLREIRVQFGCRNQPTQQRISLTTIPHSLREISWLKPRKTLPVAPRTKLFLQLQRLPNLHCVSPSLSHASLASAFLGLRLPQEALCQLWEPLRQLRWPL